MQASLVVGIATGVQCRRLLNFIYFNDWWNSVPTGARIKYWLTICEFYLKAVKIFDFLYTQIVLNNFFGLQ